MDIIFGSSCFYVERAKRGRILASIPYTRNKNKRNAILYFTLNRISTATIFWRFNWRWKGKLGYHFSNATTLHPIVVVIQYLSKPDYIKQSYSYKLLLLTLFEVFYMKAKCSKTYIISNDKKVMYYIDCILNFWNFSCYYLCHFLLYYYACWT